MSDPPSEHAAQHAPQRVQITGLFPELLGVGGVQEAGRLTALAADDIARQRGWPANFAGLNDPRGTQSFTISQRTVALEGFSRAKITFILAARRRIRAARGGVHIIIAGHPNLAPIAVYLQRTSPQTRAIVIAHGIEVWQPLLLFRRAAMRRASLVAAPSSDTIRKLIDVQGIPSMRTRLLPWPLNPDFLHLTEGTGLRAPADFPQGPTIKIILTIGRAAAAEQYKGTDNLIRAIAQLQPAFPDLHLVAVGGGDDLPRLKSLADDSGVAARVHFLDRLSREDLATCYVRADIFAMPSAGEGFGLVFLEAMAFAKPVVAANCGGALDLVRDGVNGLLVPPRDPASLASALRRLLEDDSLRASLGSQGAAIAREKYEFAAFQANLEHLLDECAIDSENRT